MITFALVTVAVLMACRQLSVNPGVVATPATPTPPANPKRMIVDIYDQGGIDAQLVPQDPQVTPTVIDAPYGDPWVPTDPPQGPIRDYANPRIPDAILWTAPWPTGYMLRGDGSVVWVTDDAIYLVYDYGLPYESKSGAWVQGITRSGDSFQASDGPAYSGTYGDNFITFSWGETFRLLTRAVGDPSMPVKTPQQVLPVPTDPQLPTLPPNSGGPAQNSGAMPDVVTTNGIPQPGDFAYPTPTPETDPNLNVYWASDPPVLYDQEQPCPLENWTAEQTQPADNPDGDTVIDFSDGFAQQVNA